MGTKLVKLICASLFYEYYKPFEKDIELVKFIKYFNYQPFHLSVLMVSDISTKKNDKSHVLILRKKRACCSAPIPN